MPTASEFGYDMATGPEAILEPVNEPDSANLPRSPTLEAQREPPTTRRGFKSWRKVILAIDDAPDDITEQKLKAAIAKSEGDVRHHLRDLLSAYSLLKHKAGHGIGHELFQCFTITDGSQDGVIKSMTWASDLDASPD